MNEYKNICAYFIGVVIIIMMYHGIMRILYGPNFRYYDVMNKLAIHIPLLKSNLKILPFDPEPPECCSGWPLSHFILFMVLAFKFPQHAKFLFVTGVMWEVVESLIGYITKDRTVKMDTEMTKTMYKSQWWTGNFNDILFNTAGIIAGLCLKKYYK